MQRNVSANALYVCTIEMPGKAIWRLYTGVDKGGSPAPPPIAGQKKEFSVKIEGLLEPIVLNLSFRARSNVMFTSERRY